MRAMRELTPPNGWQYPIGDQVLRGATRDQLIGRIRDYKIEHGMPAGDPDLELDEFVCHAYPQCCTGGSGAVTTPRPAPAPNRDQSLLDRVSAWLTAVADEVPILFVSQEAASVRAGICAQCPLRAPIPGGCGKCAARVRRLVKALLAGRTIGRREQSALGLCRHYETHLGLAVWVEEERARNGRRTEPVVACWLRREL